jgi:DNA-3-methyladenine glycosylase
VTASAELRDVLAGPVLDVAPRLLNAVVRHGEVAVRLTEVEAYDGASDPGSHAYRGRTRRNATMFGPPGHLYCYFTYGMHVCSNVVCGPEGTSSALLLRAGEVVEGLDAARARRPPVHRARPGEGTGPGSAPRWASGSTSTAPTWPAGPVTLELGPPAGEVRSGPRVGLRGAAERPWRFWITDDPTVSAYRPAAPRRATGR